MKKDTPKKRPASQKRKWLYVLLGVIAVVSLLILTTPFWLHKVAPPLIAQFAGATVTQIEKLPEGRWKVSGVDFRNETMELTVDEVEMPSPTSYLFSVLGKTASKTEVSIENWSLNLLPTDAAETKESSPLSLYRLHQNIEKAVETALDYLGAATVNDGVVSQDGGTLLSVPAFTLADSNISTSIELTQLERALTIQLNDLDEDTWTLVVNDPKDAIDLELDLERHPESLVADGTIVYTENKLNYRAAWNAGSEALLPDTASLQAESIVLDSRYEFWKETPPANLALEAKWTGESFEYKISSNESDASTIGSYVDISGSGDLHRITLQEGQVRLPWIGLIIDSPFSTDYALKDPEGTSSLKLAIDLGKSPVPHVTGILQAQVDVDTNEAEELTYDAKIAGDRIRFQDKEITTITANAAGTARTVSISALRLGLPDGSTAQGSAEIDITNRSITRSELQAAITPDLAFIPDSLPPFKWESLAVIATANGTFTDPSFTLQTDLKQLEYTNLYPLDLAINADGDLSEQNATLSLSNQNATLSLNLLSTLYEDTLAVTVSDFSEKRKDNARTLTQTGQTQITTDLASGHLTVSNFSLSAENGMMLDLKRAEIQQDSLVSELSARSLDTSIARDWLQSELPDIRVPRLDTQIALTPEGGNAELNAEAAWSIDDENTFFATWTIEQVDSISRLASFELTSNDKAFLTATGRAPVDLRWQDAQLHPLIDYEADYNLQIESQPHPEFWKNISTIAPLEIVQPVVDVDLNGTLSQPVGRAKLTVNSLSWTPENAPEKAIKLTKFNTELNVDNESIRLVDLSAALGANRIHAEAFAPVKDGIVEFIASREYQELKDKVTGSAVIEVVDLKSFDAWLPDFMRESGSVTLNAELTPERQFIVAKIANIATRPSPPLSPLSEIGGEVSFENGVVTVKELKGKAEQSPFSLAGTIDLTEGVDSPVYDLKIDGKEFPLVKDTGILLEGDVNLSLKTPQDSEPVLGGEIIMKSGLLLIETDLFSSSTRSNSVSPPFFSVDLAPFKTWLFDLRARGDSFLNVSNSFFQGDLSADFNLSGTFGEPLLLGRIDVESGRINFPASSLTIREGLASITRDQPNTIQVDATATGRLYGYDTNLAVDGSVDDLEVVFTTTPALTQAEALLLVTSGTLPNGEGKSAQQSAASIGSFIGKGLFKKLLPQGGDSSANELSLEIGNDVSLQGKNTIEARYRLSEKWEVEGEYDKRDEYNANLIWTFFRK